MADGGFALQVGPRVEGRVTLSVRGELDSDTAPQLSAALEALAVEPELELWLDLHAVTFIDSSGLRTLLDARHLFPERMFVRVDGRARDLLEITGCDRFLAIRS